MILCLVLTISVSFLSATEYYVSPNGSDDNSGTIETPFQTIQHAADLMQSGDNCYLRAGIYHEEIQINNLNGNSSDPITFTNYQDEPVILDGTIPITSSWTVHDGNIYKTTLTEDIWQLFVDGEEMVMARWPNARFDDETIWDQEDHWAHGDENESVNGTEVDDPHSGADLTSLSFSIEGALAVLNVGSFRTWTKNVESHSAGSNSFTYAQVPDDAYRTKHHYYFLEKKLEFLDQESEWFFDHETNELYFWPSGNADPNNLNIRGKVQSYSFQIENSDYIELKGLHFFASTFKMENSDYMVVDSCNFLYPSCYKRMLGVVDTEPEMTLITGGSYCTVSQCAFRYTDGGAIETSGGTNTIENCYFYHIDYTVTDLSSVMTTIRMGGSNNVFRQNTLHRTGASSGINPGDLSIVEYNDMYDTGYLQSDGAIVHLMEGQQLDAEIRYNWLHDSPKYGVRFDGDGDGTQGSMHHNVSWNIKTGHQVKGHHHFVYNNTSFDTEQNSIVILIDLGGNEGTITRNNAADKISGHRQDSYQDYPVPGIYDHNWNGYETGGDVRDLLISPPAYENFEDYSPDQYDFRPNPDSELIDAGIHVEGITDGYVGSAPDLGAYEYGGENWSPGITWDVSSYQLPVVANAGNDILIISDEDGSATVTLDGSGSYDPNGDALTYSWTLDSTVVSTDVSFNYNLNVGVFTFTLTVSNGVLTASDDVVVTVNEYVANSALSFTAANEDYVDCGNDAELQMGTHGITIEFWLKSSASGTNRIIGNGGSGSSDDGYTVKFIGNGKLRFDFGDGTTSDGKQTNAIVNDGNWHHCAIVFDPYNMVGEELTPKLWACVDGACNTKLTNTSIGNCDNTNDTFVLGRKSTSNANDSFTGSLDEVRIWNTALDEATMDAWRNGELTNSHPNISDLQVYYKFNEGSGTTANDLTADYLDSYESDGTITGAQWVASDISGFAVYDDEDLQEGGGPSEVDILVSNNAGWNLVGLPAGVEDGSLSAVYPGGTGGTLYSYDGAYVGVDGLVSGEGYWLHFPDAGTTTITGAPISSLTLSLTAGWNLISGISETTDVSAISDPGGIIVAGTIYEFTASYASASVLTPGQGYWINASADGDITISSGGAAKTRSAAFTDRTKEANILSFNGSELYFGVSIPDEEFLSYQLPPKPPVGAFDVRFADDMKVAENSGTIEIMNNTDKLTISCTINIDAGEHMKWVLTSDEGEEYELNGSEGIVVNGDVTGFTLKKAPEIPLTFSVSQNYPNPFNPETSIRYEIPAENFVTISVYNIMGKKITDLVHEIRPVGYHHTTWNSTNMHGESVASGVYIYTITAGDYRAVKKMVMIK
jgi:hypothetical protein